MFKTIINHPPNYHKIGGINNSQLWVVYYIIDIVYVVDMLGQFGMIIPNSQSQTALMFVGGLVSGRYFKHCDFP